MLTVSSLVEGYSTVVEVRGGSESWLEVDPVDD